VRCHAPKLRSPEAVLNIGRGAVRLWTAGSFAVAVCSAGASRAEGARAGIVVTREPGAEDCPSADELRDAVQKLAHDATIVSGGVGDAEVVVHVEFGRSFDGFRARIHPSERGGWQREISDLGPRCTSLAGAVSITLAIFFDDRVADSQRPAQPPAAGPVPVPLAPRRFGLAPELGGGAAVGVLVSPVPLLTAGFDFALGTSLSVGGGAMYLAPDNHPAVGGSMQLDLMAAWLRFCAVAMGGRDTFEVRLCAQPMLGSLRGRGVGYPDARSARDTWVALAGGVVASGPIGARLGWMANVMAEAPLVRQGFSVSASRPIEVFETPAVGAIVALGLKVQL
jgi:hypothetical protein